MKYYLTLVLLLAAPLAQARFATALLFEPYVQGVQGKAYNKNNDHKTAFTGWAGGARAGLAFSHLQLFGEAQYGSFSTSATTQTTSEQFLSPFVKPTLMQYGAGAALNIWYLQLHYTYFMSSTLKSNISGFSDSYTYHGSSQQFGIKMMLLDGWSLGAGYSKAEYKKYSLSQNLTSGSDQILKGSNDDRTSLLTDSYNLQISYQFLF